MLGLMILYHRYIIKMTHLELIVPTIGTEISEKLETRQNGC
jgi:hypothetical protein